MSAVDLLALIVAVMGVMAAAIARKTWLLVEGDLAASWRWLLPSVPVYAASFTVLLVHNYLERFGVVAPVFSANFVVDLVNGNLAFSMQVWEPIILVLKNIQVLGELVFLILVIIGLSRQYKVFRELSTNRE